MSHRAFVVAIDFGGTKVALASASATLSGDILDQVRFDTDASRGAEQAVHHITQSMWRGHSLPPRSDQPAAGASQQELCRQGSFLHTGLCSRLTPRGGGTSRSNRSSGRG
jgi:hypothetical protein